MTCLRLLRILGTTPLYMEARLGRLCKGGQMEMARAELWLPSHPGAGSLCPSEQPLGELGRQDCLVRTDMTVAWPPDLSG